MLVFLSEIVVFCSKHDWGFLDLMVSNFSLGKHGCGRATKYERVVAESSDGKNGYGGQKKANYVTQPEHDTNRGFSIIVKSPLKTTSAISIRMYVQSFWK